VVIPAHIWTPWFSLFGSKSGFDSVEECYGEFSDRIFAMETGLSSDPAMNWRVPALDKITLISNSDAHSGQNLMREANVFELAEVSYESIINSIKEKNPKKFIFTLEYYPQEGMYHWDGHREHNVSMSPEEAKKLCNICPVCQKQMTIGVEHRVFDLADRPIGHIPEGNIPFKNVVPLDEIISIVWKVGASSKRISREYERMVREYGSEYEILIERRKEELKGVDPVVIKAIMKVREGKVKIRPGYDGVYGEVSIDY
jgi:uncharacterized protein (TIGR00375 family)